MWEAGSENGVAETQTRHLVMPVSQAVTTTVPKACLASRYFTVDLVDFRVYTDVLKEPKWGMTLWHSG